MLAFIRAEEDRLEWALARTEMWVRAKVKAQEQLQDASAAKAIAGKLRGAKTRVKAQEQLQAVAGAIVGKPSGAKARVNMARLPLELPAKLNAALRSGGSEIKKLL